MHASGITPGDQAEAIVLISWTQPGPEDGLSAWVGMRWRDGTRYATCGTICAGSVESNDAAFSERACAVQVGSREPPMSKDNCWNLQGSAFLGRQRALGDSLFT